jgi:SPP1 family predicted phage head-tail adaptor
MGNEISSTELGQLRADVEAFTLPDTCNLLTLTRTGDSQGGWTESWGTTIAGVPCRLDGKGGKEAAVAEAVQAFSTWVLTVPQATTITAAMRVEHEDNTYNVKAVDEGGSWQIVKRAILGRV